MRSKGGLSFALFIVGTGLLILWAYGAANAASPAIGKPAPDFEFTDIEGNTVKLSDFSGKYVVLEWFNHGCPFVRKHYKSKKMQKLQKHYTANDVVWIAINSTSDKHGDYRAAGESKDDASENGTAATHIVLDPTGDIGLAYGAKTTPHMFIVDPQGKLIYAGAADSIKSTDLEDIPKATNYIDLALTESMGEDEVSQPETKPYGCSVKYK
ncbi:MAG: redoxin domain-containing protein [Deltaproteobacteria bacterium]